MDSNSIKFHVIMVDTENHDIKILDTCYSYQEAAEFMKLRKRPFESSAPAPHGVGETP